MKTNNQTSVTTAIGNSGLVVIMRIDDTELILDIAQALYRGGIRCFEVPMTTRGAAMAITRLVDRLGNDAMVGAGTVLKPEDANAVIDGGAVFVVSPHFDPVIAEVCVASQTSFIPGAFSPKEIYEAWKAGADVVKVFSIRPLGPGYISDLLGPYPSLRLMPTGGISLGNASSFIRAGSFAVTIGRDLLGNEFSSADSLENIFLRAESLAADIRMAKANSNQKAGLT